jgi:hypothetical protein
MSFVALSLGLLSLVGHLQTRGQAVERHRLDGWTYVVAVDRFTGGRRCEIRQKAVTIRAGVATFDFGRRTDTRYAYYRLDDLAPRGVADLALDLRRAGAPAIASDDLKNPSGGLVRMPLTTLLGAQRIAIRADQRRDARVFDLRGLKAVMDAAKADGCDPQAPA